MAFAVSLPLAGGRDLLRDPVLAAGSGLSVGCQLGPRTTPPAPKVALETGLSRVARCNMAVSLSRPACEVNHCGETKRGAPTACVRKLREQKARYQERVDAATREISNEINAKSVPPRLTPT